MLLAFCRFMTVNKHWLTCVAVNENIRCVVITCRFLSGFLNICKSWWFQLLLHVSMAEGTTFFRDIAMHVLILLYSTSFDLMNVLYSVFNLSMSGLLNRTLIPYRPTPMSPHLQWHLTFTWRFALPHKKRHVGIKTSSIMTCHYLLCQKQYLYFLMISISVTCCTMWGNTVLITVMIYDTAVVGTLERGVIRRYNGWMGDINREVISVYLMDDIFFRIISNRSFHPATWKWWKFLVQ